MDKSLAMRPKPLTLIAILFFFVSLPVLAQRPAVKTFTSSDGAFTFNYPNDWSVRVVNADQPNTSVVVSNLPDEQLFDSPDGVSLQIFLPMKSFLIASSSDLTPKEAIAQLVHGVTAPASINFSTPSPNGTPQPLELEPGSVDIKEFGVNGKSAAYAYNIMQVMGMDASQLIVIADLGDDYWVSMMATSFKGGLPALQRYEVIILAIVQTMRFTPPTPLYSGNPDLPQVYSGLVGIWQRGSIQFDYPQDWYAFYQLATVLISNKPGNLVNKEPESGQFIAAVQGVSETRVAVDPTILSSQCDVEKSDFTARTLVEKILGNMTSAQLEAMKNTGITMTNPEVKTVNGKEIVYLRRYQNDFESLEMFIDLGQGYIPSMLIVTKPGEMAQFEDQLFAVAGTFAYTPKPCDQQGTPTAKT